MDREGKRVSGSRKKKPLRRRKGGELCFLTAKRGKKCAAGGMYLNLRSQWGESTKVFTENGGNEKIGKKKDGSEPEKKKWEEKHKRHSFEN